MYQQKLAQYLEKFPPPAAAKPSYNAAPAPTNPAWTNSAYIAGPSSAPPLQPKLCLQKPPVNHITKIYPDRQSVEGIPTHNPRRSSLRPQRQQPAGNSMSNQFHALRGKWDEVNSLINLDNMIKALDIYISMLRSATSNEGLFQIFSVTFSLASILGRSFHVRSVEF